MKKYLILLVFSLIIAACGKKEAKKETIKDENPIVKDSIKETVNEIEEVPQLIFTVQIAALKTQSSRFNNIENIQVFEEDNFIKYRLGQFATYQEARSFRKLLLNRYSDAFLQALKNGEPINIKEALSN